MRDLINHPSHYNSGKIEVIDFIEDQGLDFCLANVIKYICRARHKGTFEQDLHKAQWYLNRYINKEVDNEGQEANCPGEDRDNGQLFLFDREDLER